ncbi:MAG: MATE family efflux transporter [Burkholderiaceae bacterium]
MAVGDVPAPAGGPAPRPASANPLVSGPILNTLVRLSIPNVLAMLMTVLVGVAETYYIGRLGTTPLAAMALVFPFSMLTGMMSAGAMGGGVSSAVSRALGASDVERANVLALHAAVIGTLAGIAYSIVFVAAGPALYALLGGRGDVLAQATRYGTVLFSAALLVWLSNTLMSVIRGTGNVRVPAVTMLATSALQIVLGGALGLGFGPVPSFGMVGVAVGQIVSNAIAVAIFAGYLMAGHGRLTLHWRGVTLNRHMFWDILKVGAVACLSPLQSIATAVIITGLVARLGVQALAGYGIGQRLEFMLIPVAFGIGVAAVPMVGMAIGAGLVARARRVAWTAGGLSALNMGVIGLAVTVAPDLWSSIFTSDPEVLDATRLYLRAAGPAFPFFGLGLTLYFASQGAGKVGGPVIASTVRLVLIAAVGAALAASGAPAWQFFALIALGMIIYGTGTATAVWRSDWTPRRKAA